MLQLLLLPDCRVLTQRSWRKYNFIVICQGLKVDICLVYFFLNVSLQITSRSFINIAADIITLDVSGNNVHLIEREAFSGINHTLEVLLLHHNYLIQILPHFFSNLRKVCEYGIHMYLYPPVSAALNPLSNTSNQLSNTSNQLSDTSNQLSDTSNQLSVTVTSVPYNRMPFGVENTYVSHL